MYLPTFIVAFVILTMLMSMVYFYLFAKGNQGAFIRYWGLSWLFYSLSLLFLFLDQQDPNFYFISLRKIFDMLNISFLLFGSYSFAHIRIPTFWLRFSLYMLLWVAIGVIYRLDTLSTLLPITVYQLFITATLCYIIFRHWKVSNFEKALSIAVFFIWGFGKSVLSIMEIEFGAEANIYLMEIIFSNILNFSIFVIYLQRARSQIEMADRLYRIIAENATDVVFYYSLKPQKAFTYITPSVEEMTGYSPAEFYSDPEFYFQLVPSSQFDEIEILFKGEEKHQGPYTKVFRLIHKNSSMIWGEFNVSTIFENNEPVAVEGFIRDITTMKDAESELLSSRQSRELLLSYISHELKTPVTSIVGYVNALKDGTIKESKDVESAIDIIFAKAQTLERLINDLFQLSKLETNQFSFRFLRIDAIELSKNLLNKHMLDIRTADLKLEYKINNRSLNQVYLIVDLERIEQVFSNIIINAIRHTPPGGKLVIKFGLDPEKSSYSVSVTDSGLGINEIDLPHIFERFYKGTASPQSRLGASSGLGLTISKEIIAAHNGTISVKSPPGKGSVFTFTIPVYKE